MSPIEMLAAIESGALLGSKTFDGVDYDAVLEALEGSAAYEAEWLRLKEAVDRAWDAAGPNPMIRDLAERIRKHVFFVVSRVSQQHEIAAHVADDFDLIVRGRVAGVDDAFLERLWGAYRSHRLPSLSILAAGN